MRIKLACLVMLFLIGCGDSDEPILPGIGADASQSVVTDVEYRKTMVGLSCDASLFPATVLVSQQEVSLTVKSGNQTLATGTIDSSGNVQLSLLEAGTGGTNLSCSGLFNEGVVDMSCPVGSVTCEFTYTRADLADE